jgi:zinc protease
MYELNSLRTEKVPQYELDGIKNFLNGSFAISLEDPETVARFAINIERYHLPKDYYENYLKNLAAVTSDDVYAMAQKYIRPDNATILVVGDQESISKSLERFSSTKSVELYDFNGNPVTKTAVKPVPAGVTPKTVIDAYTKALGGEKALLAVKDVKIKFNTEIQGRAMSLETMHKAPNKYAMSFNMGVMTLQKQTYDGTKGKQSGLEGKKEITGEELEELKSEAIMNPEMQYEKMGHKLNLKGIEAINGSDAYILEVVSPSGKKSTEWYDVASGLKVKSSTTTTTQGQTITQVTEFGDYKDYSGVKYPGSVSITGTPMPLKLKLESVEVNKGISDSAFTE